MGLKSTVKGGVDTAFKVLKELVQTVTFTPAEGEYDPNSGEVDPQTTWTCPALFTGTVERASDPVKVGDNKVIFRVSDTKEELVPGMTFVDAKERDWILVSVSADPTGAAYDCVARRVT